MKKVLLVTLIVVNYTLCCAQSTHQLDKDTLKCKTKPIIEINNANEKIVMGYESTAFLDLNNINSINIYKKPPGTTNQYETENGVIAIELKSKVDFIGFDKLLEKYNITDITLPTYLDSSIVCKPKLLQIIMAKIKSVKIEQEKNTGMKYISILSTNPIHHENNIQERKDGVIYIKGISSAN